MVTRNINNKNRNKIVKGTQVSKDYDTSRHLSASVESANAYEDSRVATAKICNATYMNIYMVLMVCKLCFNNGMTSLGRSTWGMILGDSFT